MIQTLLFFVLAAVAVASALLVIFNRNAVHSALYLLLNLASVSILYILLNAPFIAIAQIIVYAGAIVVLILFVIMLLGAELGETIPSWLTARNGVVIFLGAVLLTIIGTAGFDYLHQTQPIRGNVTDEMIATYGHVELVGLALFTDYMLAFQLAGVLLLIGIMGVVALGSWRKVQHKEQVKK